jgi:predicted transcriptional regulator
MKGKSHAQKLRSRLKAIGFFKHLNLTSIDNDVLDSICTFLSEKDSYSATIDEIASRCLTSRSSILRSIKRLVDQKIITVTTDKAKKNKNIYHLSAGMIKLREIINSHNINDRSKVDLKWLESLWCQPDTTEEWCSVTQTLHRCQADTTVVSHRHYYSFNRNNSNNKQKVFAAQSQDETTEIKSIKELLKFRTDQNLDEKDQRFYDVQKKIYGKIKYHEMIEIPEEANMRSLLEQEFAKIYNAMDEAS